MASRTPSNHYQIRWDDPDPMDAPTLRTINRLIEEGVIPPGVVLLTRPKLAKLLGCEHGRPERRPCGNCLGAN